MSRSLQFLGTLAAIAVAACGGATSSALVSGDEGGITDGSTSPDAQTTTGSEGGVAPSDAGATPDSTVNGTDAATLSPFCPPVPPSIGSACTRVNLTCEYGTSDDPLCNTTYECNGQTWAKGYDGTNCGYSGTNDPACPATYATASKGGACGGFSVCEYAEGMCECIISCGGPPPPPDAGDHWVCSPSPAGCPSPRGGAKLGAACATPGEICNYGMCCSGANQTCTDAGIWEGNIFGGGCP
jgi:hypothetical protein